MYAVIKTGGKQYKVATGDVVKIEKIAGEEGKEVISIYSHKGYEVAESSNYDNERKAQEIIKSISK